MALNLPTGIPFVYELDENFKPVVSMQFLGTSPLKKEEQAEKFEQFMSLMKGYSPQAKDQTQETAPPSTDVAILKEHIDMRFEKLTQLVSKRLDNFEAQQMEKLNKIIALLEKEK